MVFLVLPSLIFVITCQNLYIPFYIAFSKLGDKMKTKHSTLSEQFQNLIEISQIEAQSIPLPHIYRNVLLPGMIQTRP
jgi:hypothetical protein